MFSVVSVAVTLAVTVVITGFVVNPELGFIFLLQVNDEESMVIFRGLLCDEDSLLVPSDTLQANLEWLTALRFDDT